MDGRHVETDGRLLVDAPLTGAENMSRDQALLEHVDAVSVPTLRFYSWSQPTLSLGYFQHAAQRKDHSASRGCSLVRRSTGGGAILHDHELTYSLCVPSKDRVSKQVTNLYSGVHTAIIRAVRKQGLELVRFAETPHSGQRMREDAVPFLCFQRRTDDDLILSGYKIVGSAQRRGARSTLQHGSILLRSSRCAPELPGLENLSSRAIDAAELRREIAAAISESLSTRFKPSDWTHEELERAATIAMDRFANERWTNKRP